uniref:Annexin n=1 Tax=Sinocyclocheilus grahami TaxID=75366 RepID=A0A672SMF7_SINGR
LSNMGKEFRGTIADHPDFDAGSDAEALYDAMKGFGSDKEAILDLITSRSNAERQDIRAAYKSQFGKDLIDDLKYELTGKFERLIVVLMRPPAYHDAKEIKDAIKGAGTDEKCLIEILASRTNEQIHNLVAAYKDAYGRDLEEDVIGDTSGHFKKMLVVLLQGTREEDDVVSEDLVEQDAQDLYDAGEAQWGTDEAKFIMLLGNRSVIHLQLVFDEYQKIAEKSIEDSIKSELSGDFERLMLAVVQCIRSKPMFFAKRLYKSMKGLGTADNTLIRIMVSRSEIDMLDIRECFRLRYEKSLYNMIQDDTSGDYKRTLLKLCGGDDDMAGEFFPEAAQIAYKMWEISAMTKIQLRGTVRPYQNFDPASDAQGLRKAMKGFGTDEDTIIDIVAHRSNAQRQEIRQTFKSLLGRDLMADLKSELSKNLQRLILGLMMTPAEFEIKSLRNGVFTTVSTIIYLQVDYPSLYVYPYILTFFYIAYKKSLEDAIASDTSGHFKRILISLAQVHLHSSCIQTLTHSSYFVLYELIFYFNRIYIYIYIITCVYFPVRSVKNQPSYFADRLYKAMKGLGTDDRALIRIMVSRAEIDLFNIRKEFKETHDTSLHEFIQVETLVVSCVLLLIHTACICACVTGAIGR